MILLSDNTVTHDGITVHSGCAEKAKDAKCRQLAEAFEYQPFQIYTDRDGQVEEEIAFDGDHTITVTSWKVKTVGSQQCAKPYNEAGDIRTIYQTEKVEKSSKSFTPMDDISGESERVQKFAAIVFADLELPHEQDMFNGQGEKIGRAMVAFGKIEKWIEGCPPQ